MQFTGRGAHEITHWHVDVIVYVGTIGLSRKPMVVNPREHIRYLTVSLRLEIFQQSIRPHIIILMNIERAWLPLMPINRSSLYRFSCLKVIVVFEIGQSICHMSRREGRLDPLVDRHGFLLTLILCIIQWSRLRMTFRMTQLLLFLVSYTDQFFH